MSTPLRADDAEFLRAFEAAEIPCTEWDHAAHVRMAWTMLRSAPLPEATDRVRTALRRIMAAYGIVEGPEQGYHETLTVAWLRVVHARLGDHHDAAAFLADHPALLDKRYLLRHYSRALLLSAHARHGFGEPDLAPLDGG